MSNVVSEEDLARLVKSGLNEEDTRHSILSSSLAPASVSQRVVAASTWDPTASCVVNA